MKKKINPTILRLMVDGKPVVGIEIRKRKDFLIQDAAFSKRKSVKIYSHSNQTGGETTWIDVSVL